MCIKHLIAGLSIGVCISYTAYAETYLVLPDDTTKSGASAGTSDFIDSFDGLDTKVRIAEELAGDGSDFEIPLEFAITTDTVNEWASEPLEAVVSIALDNARFTRTVTLSDIVGIGACTAKATSIISGGEVFGRSVIFLVDNISLCDNTAITPTGPDGGPSAADALTSALAFTLPVKTIIGSFVDVRYSILSEVSKTTLSSGALSTHGYDDLGRPVGADLFSTEPAFTYEIETVPEVIIVQSSGYNNIRSESDLINSQDGNCYSLMAIKTQGVLGRDFATPVSLRDISESGVVFEYESPQEFSAHISRFSYDGQALHMERILNISNLSGFQDIAEDLVSNTVHPPLLTDDNEPISYDHFFCLKLDTGPDFDTLITPQDISLTYNIDFSDEVFTDPNEPIRSTISMRRLDDSFLMGRFEWVSDSDGLTPQNLFRITGIKKDTPGILGLFTENSSEPPDSIGYIALSEVMDENGNAILTSTHLTEVLGNFGRADITMRLLGLPDGNPNLRIRRLLQSTTGAVTEMAIDYSVNDIAVK